MLLVGDLARNILKLCFKCTTKRDHYHLNPIQEYFESIYNPFYYQSVFMRNCPYEIVQQEHSSITTGK